MDQEETVFSATSEGDSDHRRVVVTGEVDMATADQMFQAATREPATEVTLDLRAVTFFDSAAIQALVRLTDRIPQLAVIPSRRVRRVLDIAGLGEQSWLAPE
ncbi:STAS domain-containing protein [Asanoa sp. NPDC049573]|uniref:STAS domain-containing protein n=1 Tax=Asanoa sp. NPDC049573 TaxID=3155396 RepID=UPI00342CC986